MADPAFEAAGIVWDAEEELSVNQLRQLMLEELHRRNFADTTVRTYGWTSRAAQPLIKSYKGR